MCVCVIGAVQSYSDCASCEMNFRWTNKETNIRIGRMAEKENASLDQRFLKRKTPNEIRFKLFKISARCTNWWIPFWLTNWSTHWTFCNDHIAVALSCTVNYHQPDPAMVFLSVCHPLPLHPSVCSISPFSLVECTSDNRNDNLNSFPLASDGSDILGPQSSGTIHFHWIFVRT